MADLTEMPFGVVDQMGPENHVLDWVQKPLWKGANFGMKSSGAMKCIGRMQLWQCGLFLELLWDFLFILGNGTGIEELA